MHFHAVFGEAHFGGERQSVGIVRDKSVQILRDESAQAFAIAIGGAPRGPHSAPIKTRTSVRCFIAFDFIPYSTRTAPR